MTAAMRTASVIRILRIGLITADYTDSADKFVDCHSERSEESLNRFLATQKSEI